MVLNHCNKCFMGWNKSKYVNLWFETMRLFLQIILVNNLIPTWHLIHFVHWTFLARRPDKLLDKTWFVKAAWKDKWERGIFGSPGAYAITWCPSSSLVSWAHFVAAGAIDPHLCTYVPPGRSNSHTKFWSSLIFVPFLYYFSEPTGLPSTVTRLQNIGYRF
jgi:hypothetical protein